ncbi:hypothetical protein CEXT_503571 [Caerostris extrusa]|uniref:Uncharacterized protein n=1 Tax=Caerostris extrusa TaxID=172846 RepID=A0AAV4VT57_CAEEX|nr:hypothetical protein CEXT_503571 [Caerostris extrusa]
MARGVALKSSQGGGRCGGKGALTADDFFSPCACISAARLPLTHSALHLMDFLAAILTIGEIAAMEEISSTGISSSSLENLPRTSGNPHRIIRRRAFEMTQARGVVLKSSQGGGDAAEKRNFSIDLNSIETNFTEPNTIETDCTELNSIETDSIYLISIEIDSTEIDSIKTNSTELKSMEIDSIELNAIYSSETNNCTRWPRTI